MNWNDPRPERIVKQHKHQPNHRTPDDVSDQAHDLGLSALEHHHVHTRHQRYGQQGALHSPDHAGICAEDRTRIGNRPKFGRIDAEYRSDHHADRQFNLQSDHSVCPPCQHSNIGRMQIMAIIIPNNRPPVSPAAAPASSVFPSPIEASLIVVPVMFSPLERRNGCSAPTLVLACTILVLLPARAEKASYLIKATSFGAFPRDGRQSGKIVHYCRKFDRRRQTCSCTVYIFG